MAKPHAQFKIPRKFFRDGNQFNYGNLNSYEIPTASFAGAPTFQYAEPATKYIEKPNTYTLGGGVNGGVGLKNWFVNHFGEGKSLLGGKGPDISSLKAFPGQLRATQLYQGGPRLGSLGAAGMGAYQGIQAIQGLTENAQADTDYNNLIRDVKNSAYANPAVSQYLTADQNRLLRQARTGNLDTANWGGAAAGAAQGIPKALLATLLGGLIGGPAGAALGGIGSLGNSAIQGYGDRTREQSDKLSGLYQALQNAEMSYNDEANTRLRQRHFSRMY